MVSSNSGGDGVSSSTLSSVATMFKATVGAGVLSLPYAFKEAGALGAVLLCLFVCLCEGFTLYVLAKFAERYGRQSYTQLVRATLGKKLSASLPLLLVLFSFGDCIAFMMITGDAFSALARGYLGDDSILGDRQMVMIVIAVVAMLPMCLAKTLSALVYVSSTAFLGFIYTAAIVVVEGWKGYSGRQPDPLDGIVWLKWDIGVLYALPIIVFGFNCHTNIITIFQELKDEPDSILRRSGSMSRQTEKMGNMLEVIVLGLALILTGYITMGLAGYVGLLNVSSNILLDLPDNTMVQLARVVMAFIVMFTYPMAHFPAREGFQDALVMCGMEDASESTLLSALFTVVFVAGTTAIAMVVTDLGIILNIVGGTVASFFIFSIPGLMLINEAVMKHSKRLVSRHQSSSGIAQMADAEAQGEAAPLIVEQSSTTTLSSPLLERLQLVADKGIKKSGLMYSPGKSWAAGIFLIVLSIAISGITVYTAVVKM